MAGQEFRPRNIRRSVLSGAKTSHQAALDIPFQNDTTVVIHIAIEAITGTSVTLSTYGVHPVTGRVTASTLLASAAITAVGYSTLTIGPGVATVANVSLQAICPRVLRLIFTGTVSAYTPDVTIESF